MALSPFSRMFHTQMGGGGDFTSLPPALQQIMQWQRGGFDRGMQSGGDRFGGNPSSGQRPDTSFQGSGLSGGPARQALTSFNFRRNFAAGGLVSGPNTPPGAGLPQANMSVDQLSGTLDKAVQANPQIVQQLQQVIMQALQSGELTMDQLNMAVQLAKAAAQNPELWPRLRQMAIQQGLATEDELPPQYDQGIVFAILLAGQAIQQGVQQSQGAPRPGGNYAEGGQISPSRSPDKSGVADDIKINVSGGEFVIPKHVVAAKGTEFFERMLEQYDPKNPDSKVNKA